MIGVVFCAYGRLGDGLLEAMEHVVGPQDHVATVAIGSNDDEAGRLDDLRDAVRRVDDGDGVIILTDLADGVPYRLAVQLLGNAVEVVSGTNLPLTIMLDKARRNLGLKECAAKLREAGRRYISVASEVFGESKFDEPGVDDATASAVAGDASDVMFESFDRLVEDLRHFRNLVRVEQAVQPGSHHRGHNAPPQLLDLEPDILNEGVLAVAALQAELQTDQPKQQVLEFCLAILDKVFELVKTIARWVVARNSQVDAESRRLVEETKGRILMTPTVASQIERDLAKAIEFAEQMVMKLFR